MGWLVRYNGERHSMQPLSQKQSRSQEIMQEHLNKLTKEERLEVQVYINKHRENLRQRQIKIMRMKQFAHVFREHIETGKS